jgi:hypothetical protein
MPPRSVTRIASLSLLLNYALIKRHAMKAHEKGKSILSLIASLSTSSLDCFASEKKFLVPTKHGAGWAPEPVGTI